MRRSSNLQAIKWRYKRCHSLQGKCFSWRSWTAPLNIKNVSKNCKGSQRTRCCKIVIETFNDNLMADKRLFNITKISQTGTVCRSIGEQKLLYIAKIICCASIVVNGITSDGGCLKTVAIYSSDSWFGCPIFFSFLFSFLFLLKLLKPEKSMQSHKHHYINKRIIYSISYSITPIQLLPLYSMSNIYFQFICQNSQNARQNRNPSINHQSPWGANVNHQQIFFSGGHSSH